VESREERRGTRRRDNWSGPMLDNGGKERKTKGEREKKKKRDANILILIL